MMQTGRMAGNHGSAAGTAVWSVGDRYLVGPCIGQGGMADVYEAHDSRLGRPVAVKVLQARYASDEVLRRRLQVEARAAARLSHPNVARVYDVGEHEGLPCIVMELVGGGTMAERFRDPPMGQGEAVGLIIQVLEALDAAHRAGILHRDIKPANVLLTEDGVPKVTDFGIAKALEPAPDELDLTMSRDVIGTPRYLAPERAAGDEASVASDLWAVGVVLYEALTGRPPFDAGSALGLAVAADRGEFLPPETYRPDVAPAVGAVVTRALSPRPVDRYRSASEMAAALSWAVADPHATAVFEPSTAPYPAADPGAGRRWWLSRPYLLRGAGLLLLLSLLVAAALLWPRATHPTATTAPPASSTVPAPPTTLPPPSSAAVPTTDVPTTTASSAPSVLDCSVLRAEYQALAQRQAQIDKTEKSQARRGAAKRAIDSQQRAIQHVTHQFCG
jgi:serine/threonine-protein kinase